jgi:hypothetical protein
MDHHGAGARVRQTPGCLNVLGTNQRMAKVSRSYGLRKRELRRYVFGSLIEENTLRICYVCRRALRHEGASPHGRYNIAGA